MKYFNFRIQLLPSVSYKNITIYIERREGGKKGKKEGKERKTERKEGRKTHPYMSCDVLRNSIN